MSKQRNKQNEAFYSEEVGWDVDLNIENCDAETFAWLNRPDEERFMSLDEWQALYATRIADGYYDKELNTKGPNTPF